MPPRRSLEIARLEPDDFIFKPGQTVTAVVRALDYMGNDRSNVAVRVELVRLDYRGVAGPLIVFSIPLSTSTAPGIFLMASPNRGAHC